MNTSSSFWSRISGSLQLGLLERRTGEAKSAFNAATGATPRPRHNAPLSANDNLAGQVAEAPRHTLPDPRPSFAGPAQHDDTARAIERDAFIARRRSEMAAAKSRNRPKERGR